jgi:hypothetical protein
MATKATDYDLVGSYDNQRVSTISAERTVNMFEYLDPEGKRPKVLLSTAGLVDAELNFGSETDGARASFVFNNVIYQVYGDSVYRTTGSTGLLSTSLIGTITTSAGYVGIDANTYQVIFVDGQEGWIWDTNANTFEEITDTGFPDNPVDVCYLDGFFLIANGQTNTFQLSSINQGMVWSGGSASAPTGTFTVDTATDVLTLSVSNANFATGVPVTLTTTGTLPAPLAVSTTYYSIRVSPYTTNPGEIRLATSYANAIANVFIDITTTGAPTNSIIVTGQLQLGSITSHPGTIVACRTLHRRIFLFSQNFTEVWENAGLGTNLPFRRNNSLLMEVGTPALGSVSVGFDRMFFLAQDKDGLAGVMEVKGTESILVSNRALDFQLAQYAADPDTGVADARGILIKENGLIFYRLNFTLANHTFVLNVTMSTAELPKWHEEEVLNGDRHPAQTHVYFDGVNYYGDYQLPIFYIVADGVSTNNGEAIRRMRIGRQMSPDGYNRLRIDRFQIDLLQGQLAIDTFIESNLWTESAQDILTEDSEIIVLEQETRLGGAQPVVFLSISKDGGQTYGNLLQSPMGKIGERTYRTLWRKLGTTPRGQGFTPRIEFFHDIPFIILGAAWAFETLPE